MLVKTVDGRLSYAIIPGKCIRLNSHARCVYIDYIVNAMATGLLNTRMGFRVRRWDALGNDPGMFRC